MTGKDSDIDLSLSNIWQSWYNFRKGKRSSPAILEFEYYLEKNLLRLCSDLNNSRYRHGGYTYFRVTDTKPRDISIASVRDRVVHRLLYDYLVPIWDKTFIYDAWSCRKNKGLQGAINRAQSFAIKYPKYYVWRADIKKMFDSIDHAMMKQLIQRRVKSKNVLWLIDEVIDSYNALASQPALFFAPTGWVCLLVI